VWLWIRSICEILGLLSGIPADHVRYLPQFGDNMLLPSSERRSGLIRLRIRFNNSNDLEVTSTARNGLTKSEINNFQIMFCCTKLVFS
jgi:hypothetical protein